MALHRSPDEVREFWEANVCGARFVGGEYLSAEFFGEYRKFRYRKEHHLDHLIEWGSAKGKDVLEVGLGLGADASRWAEHARTFTGVVRAAN